MLGMFTLAQRRIVATGTMKTASITIVGRVFQGSPI